jgi:hypothetical protein
MARRRRNRFGPSSNKLNVGAIKISTAGSVKWNLKFDENFHPKNFLPLMEKNGRYYINRKALPMNRPEEWQSIILAEMAKNYLK